MKKIYSLFILLLMQFPILNAQNDSLERSIFNGVENYYRCALSEGDAQYFYLSYITSEANGFTLHPYITKLDSMGISIWKKTPFTGFETGSVFQMIYAFDSNLVYSGYKSMCDINGASGFIEKVSKTDGTTIWLKSFADTIYEYFGKTITQRSDSGYWLSYINQLYQLNSNGDSVTTLTYTMGDIQHITATPDSCYLLNCDNGLIKTDASGNILYSFPTMHSVNHVAVTDSNFYFFDSDTIIYRVDSALNITTQFSFADSASQINAIVNHEDSLWIILHLKSNNISRLIKSDYNFGFSAPHDFNYFNGADLDVRDILVNTNDYNLIIHEQLDEGEAVTLKSWSKANNLTYNYNSDVGVSALVVDSDYATITHIGALTIVFPHLKLRAMVTNYGLHPVDSFFVNATIPNSYPNCAWSSISINVDSVLQPGNSMWVNIGWVSCGVYDSASNPGNVIDYCFYTSSPDGLMDYNHSNDNACITFSITTFVGVNEIQIDDGIIISPNPAITQLTINSKTKLNSATIKIVDVLGNLIIERNGEANSTFNIDVNNLHAGLYFIRINAGGKSWVKKFLKM
ncbi:MAG: T9SS type A sorting domain-containing protein [Bacteroidia bacterium]